MPVSPLRSERYDLTRVEGLFLFGSAVDASPAKNDCRVSPGDGNTQNDFAGFCSTGVELSFDLRTKCGVIERTPGRRLCAI
jgi:hypothetical protein